MRSRICFCRYGAERFPLIRTLVCVVLTFEMKQAELTRTTQVVFAIINRYTVLKNKTKRQRKLKIVPGTDTV